MAYTDNPASRMSTPQQESNDASVAIAASVVFAATSIAPDLPGEPQLCDCLRRMAIGDQSGLGDLYDATAQRIYGVALRFVRDPHTAEEVVSDVYFHAWTDAAQYDPCRGRVLPWLLVCCRTRSIDALRRRNRSSGNHCDIDPQSLAEEAIDGMDLMDVMERGSAVHKALEQMTPIERQLLALSFFRGYSHGEIANRERMPLGSVKSQIRAALSRLRSILAEYR